MSKYSKINFVYFMQKWMDSVPGQTFLNYAYSWGASIVILGTLFKLTHLPGANVMLFIGMGTEVFVFFISAFDRPFDKSTIDMTLDNHMSDDSPQDSAPQVAVAPVAGVAPMVGQPGMVQPAAVGAPVAQPEYEGNEPAEVPQTVAVASAQPAAPAQPVAASAASGVPGGTIIIGGGVMGGTSAGVDSSISPAMESGSLSEPANTPAQTTEPITFEGAAAPVSEPRIVTPAPAVSPATAEAMEAATTAYVERLEQLNETLQKVEALSSRLATDSEEMENLNRTLTGIARVYEMQLKSASQQITTQDSINEQTHIMAEKIKELNAIYARMIEAMTVNMPGTKLAN